MIHRLIPTLLLSEGLLYKTKNFTTKKYIGDPINCVKIFNEKEVDELIVLDISASRNSTPPDFDLLRRLTCEAFMPFSYGGGIYNIEHAYQLFKSGIEKLIFNSAIFSSPSLITEVSNFAGSSSVIASIDFKRDKKSIPQVYSYLNSQLSKKLSLIDHAKFVEDLGAGEIFLNSVDNDGCMSGYDLDVIHQVSCSVDIPVTVCGGAGRLHDFSDALSAGASAVSAGSYFVFKGKYKAVLLNYPSQSEIDNMFTRSKENLYSRSSLASNTENTSHYQECIRCVMNSSVDPDMIFDSSGLCSHCVAFDEKKAVRLASNYQDQATVQELAEKIKSSSRNSDYDCLIGVSGGVDSSYVAFLVKSLGLRPLAVHFDNGWNSEFAVKNIESLVDKLDIDLITHVVDWQEFRDLQKSFLYSSTPDGEIPTDHGIFATMWHEADKHNIKYIVSGMNYHTESMSIPSWSYGHSDWKYISSVHNHFLNTPLTTYPHFSPSYLFYLNFIRQIKSVSILNYVPYNKSDAISILKNSLGWIPYGGKHHESIYTRFYQGYYLPKKFGIDKRYCHFSDSINIGQLTKDQALNMLQLPTYDPALMQQDLEYIMSKLQITKSEFDSLLSAPRRSFHDYSNNYRMTRLMRSTVHLLRKLNLYPK